MARARNIKPSLFKNELLGEADPMLTILFVGLWCLADRDGRVEDRPKRIKAEIFPYRETPDFNGYLTELERLGFIERYEAENQAVIQVVNFTKHQSPHKTEKPSELPAKPATARVTCKEPLDNGSLTVKESLIPDSLNPDSGLSDSKTSCTEPPGSPPAAPPEIVYSLPTNKHTTDGELFHITETMFEKFCDLYPAVDVMQALRSMDGWSLSNPSKRKTLGGMPKFINSWLAKDQNQGGNRGKAQPSARSGQYPPRAPTPAERVAAKRAVAGSPDVGAMVPDVGDVRPYLVTGSGR